MQRYKQSRTIPAQGFSPRQMTESRVIEAEEAPAGAEPTEEPLRDWTADKENS